MITALLLTGRVHEDKAPLTSTLRFGPGWRTRSASPSRADHAPRARTFLPPVYAVEASAFFAAKSQNLPLTWRTDICAHLKIVQGSCAASVNQVTISSSLAKQDGWHVGQQLTPPGWPALSIVGIYEVPDFSQLYWFGRGNTYFPSEDRTAGAAAVDPNTVGDAMFTVRETVDSNTAVSQGTVVIDQAINRSTVQAGDLDALASAIRYLGASPGLTLLTAAVESSVPTLVDEIHASWRSLAVTEFLIGAQLLVLVWLLMFLVVKDAIEARAADIALVKLRGYKGLRLIAFGLAEPASLLLIALPFGVLVGWAVSAGLSHAQLRAGMPVELPGLAWAAAAVATVGGLAAVAVAGRQALSRSVVDQWRRTQRHGSERGWVLDGIVLTGAVAGLVQLAVSGEITSVGHGSLGLLEPGLLGLAAAVVASRLLPILCRGAFGVTRRRGGLGAFLAVRHVARRPGGVRTTIILATAFALAAFGVVAWSVGRANRALVAGVSIGAPAVFTVNPAPGQDLGDVVDSLDPGGESAAVVDSYHNGGSELLAVDSDRFAHVAAWRDGFAGAPLAALAKRLHPATAAPIVLDGDAFRLRIDVEKLTLPGQVVVADVASPDSPVIQVDLGSIDHANGAVVLSGRLVGCPCTLKDIVLSPPTTTSSPNGPDEVDGSLTIEGLDVSRGGTWTPLPGITDPHQWDPNVGNGSGTTTSTPAGVRWDFTFSALSAGTLGVADHPTPMPALVSSSVVSGTLANTISTNGLDGQSLTVLPIAAASAIPGATTGAVVVDRTFAARASGGYLSALVTQQVWTTSAAAPRIEAGLRKAGVQVADAVTAASRTRLLDRQGPGLASVAFLANASAAAILAAAAAVMGLVSAGRRRRYEYAALTATGATRRTLFSGLLIEQAGVLVFGTVTGIVAGLVAAAVAVRGVPEFVTTPESPPLSYAAPVVLLAVVSAAALVGLLLVATVSSWALVRGVRSDQLREAPA